MLINVVFRHFLALFRRIQQSILRLLSVTCIVDSAQHRSSSKSSFVISSLAQTLVWAECREHDVILASGGPGRWFVRGCGVFGHQISAERRLRHVTPAGKWSLITPRIVFLPYDDLDFESALIAQNDEFKGSFMALLHVR